MINKKNVKNKSISILLTLIMVVMTLIPSWSFGQENINALSYSQKSVSETQSVGNTDYSGSSNEISEAEKPKIRDNFSEKEWAYSKGDTADALKIEASVSDGGEISFQWQLSKDGKNFSDIKDETKAAYVPDTDKEGIFYYRAVVTNILGNSSAQNISSIAEISIKASQDRALANETKNSSDMPSGEGTEQNPYNISTAEQLMWFAEEINAGNSGLCANLTGDIDLTEILKEKEWIPIGDKAAGKKYEGTFDGGSFRVSGLKIDNDKQYQAFIGHAEGAAVKNLIVSGDISTSNNYAAGIIAYGNSVEISDCINEVNVTSTGKGSIGGVISWLTGTGSKIENSVNKGNISGSGTYVGGITGSLPKGNNIERCSNEGSVKNNNKSTGGITGQLAGEINESFNSGTIEGTTNVGGIAGVCSAFSTAAKITNCYNTGIISGNSLGIGGIIGGLNVKTCLADIKNCYSIGQISAGAAESGGIVGNGQSKITASNCYYLEGSASSGDGGDLLASGIASMTDGQMRSEDEYLGESFFYSEGSYPILNWQNPNAEYEIKFSVNPQDASVTVKNSDGSTAEPYDKNKYKLKNGSYSYEVTADEYEPESGNFTVSSAGKEFSINLKVKKYDYVFDITPEDANLTVKGQEANEDGLTYSLTKAGNPYSYVVDKFGYEKKEGTFSVTGEEKSDRKAVTLAPMTKYNVVFHAEKETGGPDSEISVKVVSKEYEDENIKGEKGEFSLPDGEYKYTVSCPGYKSVKGDFEVKGSGVDIDGIILKVQTEWDGESLSEPAEDEKGVYLISNADELMWFDKNAKTSDSARLTADIRINKSVSGSDAAAEKYKWIPIGKDKSSAYTGTFDGNGHTVSGLYIENNNANTGMFGYVGDKGKIKNLTIKDSRIASIGDKNYTGIFAGDLYGSIENCHTESTVTVTGYRYVGGIAGDIESGGQISGCSNNADVLASDTNAGGITGRIDTGSLAVSESCNTGDVSGKSSVGGITGNQYAYQSVINNTYNTGNVTASDGYAGGISGNFRSGTLKNSYSAGKVSAADSGIITGRLEWTTGAKALENVYYIDSQGIDAVGNLNGCTVQSGEAVPKTSDELKGIASELGEAFEQDSSGINSGYPVLAWQNGTDISQDPEKDENGWQGEISDTAPNQENGIYQISTPAELKWFAEKSRKESSRNIKAVLTDDIDLNYNQWVCIGGTDEAAAFEGTFDGAGHTIKNLYIKNSKGSGLVGYNGGTIKNVKITGIIKNSDNAGAAAGYNAGEISEVTSCVSVSEGSYIAGIAGSNIGGVIEECHNKSMISGNGYVGGIAGYNKGTIKKCTNTAVIRSSSTFSAGIAADNDEGTVEECANSGHIINTAAVRLNFIGGIIGRNAGNAENLYNTGNIVSRGSSVGGCVGINTSGSSANNLFSLGDVSGASVDNDGVKEFRVGGAIGEVTSGVSNAYYLETIAIAESGSKGGIKANAGTIKQKAGKLTSMIEEKEHISGTVTLPEQIYAGSSVKASYKDGNAQNPVYIWYSRTDGREDVLAVSDSFSIPNDFAGSKIYVKCMDGDFYGIKTGASGEIQGLGGTVKISGFEVSGHTLKAEYQGNEKNPKYQWYRGTTAISGASKSEYTLTDEDLGKTISVKITGELPGYIQANTGTIMSSEDAGIWPEEQCRQPEIAGDVYQISTLSEFKWFVNHVNSGNTSADAALTSDISLSSSECWYPIGKDKKAYQGTFDGKNHKIENLNINSEKDEQGLFGNVGGKGIIKNLKVSGNIYVSGNGIITGGIAGYLDGKITGCEFGGNVSGNSDVGGIAGQIGKDAQIIESRNTAAVYGVESVGGITGSVSYGTVSRCINIGDVGKDELKTVKAGGIAGNMTNYAVIEACYNKGTVSGSSFMGGIAGEVSVCVVPQGCYNVGTVSKGMYSNGSVGSYVKSDYIGQTKGSFYLVSSQAEAVDETATGATSETMKKPAFADKLNSQVGAAYFAEDVKNINDGYPVLKWQTEGTSEGGGESPEEPEKTEINVSIKFIGDTAHGKDGEHTGEVVWFDRKSYTLKAGATAYDLFKKAAADAGFEYDASASGYISSIKNPDTKVTLAELTNGPYSGWMYTVNGIFPDYMSAVTLKDGDEMVVLYVDDYTKIDWDGNKTPQQAAEEVEALIEEIPDIDKLTLDDAPIVDRASSAYNSLTDEAKALVSKVLKTKLDAALAKIAKLQKTDQKAFNKIYEETGSKLLSLADKNGLTVGAAGGEWTVLGLARSEKINRSVIDDYCQNVIKHVKKKGSAKLHDSKSTDNSRVILGLTSIGKDVTDVSGYNLLEPLADFEYVKYQGLNGPVWALIALDSYDYEIPDVKTGGIQTTRENLIEYILDAQLESGGWDVEGKAADADMTAMALQALAPYYDSDSRVKSSVDSALNRLSKMQAANGSYESWGKSNAESASQVIVALTSLGIDPSSDGRFIKNGYSVLDALASFYNGDGTFKHTASSETLTENGMATEQAYYALASYYRLKDSKTALYDMSDIETMSKIVEKPDTETGTDKPEKNQHVSETVSERRAGGNTKSIKSRLTTVKQVIKMIDEILNPDDSSNAVPKDLSQLTDGQLSAIINAYKAYDSLSADEKLLVNNYEEFEELLERLGKFMHQDKDSGIVVQGIEWHHKLIVEKTAFTEEEIKGIKSVLGEDSKPLQAYDIHFEDLLSGREYKPDKPVTVKIPEHAEEGYSSSVIVHIDDESNYGYIKSKSEDGYIEFKAQEFSKYGVIAVKGAWNDILPLALKTSDYWKWIAAALAALLILASLAVVKKVRMKKYD